MCTVIALWMCHPSAPLVLALNRDEFLDRPTEGPALREGLNGAGRYVAGKDLRSGGTWFGVGHSIVAALTNHRAAVPGTSWPRSRGELVTGALGQKNIEGVRGELTRLEPEQYGGFHLLTCANDQMLWTTNYSGGWKMSEVEPGVHVLGNFGLDNEDDAVVRTMHEATRDVAKMSEPELEIFFKNALACEDEGWPCVNRNGVYGTRSSAILWWGRAEPRLLVTEGSPATSAWEDRSGLLAEIEGG